MIRVRQHPHGPRVYILGARVHHGTGGAVLALIALKLKRRRVAAGLALWACSDWRDFPFTDACNH